MRKHLSFQKKVINLFLKIFSVITTIGMLLVLLMGALVTKTGSGEGCGDDWPLCNGEIIPTKPTIETIIEYSHRSVSATVGLLIVIMAIWCWRKLPQRKESRFLATSSVFFVVLQGLLGAAAVVWSQSSAILALHFGFSLISFASVLLLTMLVFEKGNQYEVPEISQSLKRHIYGLTIYTYVVVYTGALVRHTNASLACKSWPLCGNESIFWSSIYSTIQMGHRLAAGILFFWVLYLMIKSFNTSNHVLKRSMVIAFLFILAQVTTGALIIFTLLNLNVALLHGLFIAGFFGVITYLCLLSYRSSKSHK
jgi:heme a synthase